jgi:hypothetical protein
MKIILDEIAINELVCQNIRDSIEVNGNKVAVTATPIFGGICIYCEVGEFEGYEITISEEIPS